MVTQFSQAAEGVAGLRCIILWQLKDFFIYLFGTVESIDGQNGSFFILSQSFANSSLHVI